MALFHDPFFQPHGLLFRDPVTNPEHIPDRDEISNNQAFKYVRKFNTNEFVRQLKYLSFALETPKGENRSLCSVGHAYVE